MKKQALNLLRTSSKGSGSTLAHEKLVEKDKLKLSDESVRKLTPALASGASVIKEGLWKPHKVKKVGVHQLPERRACFGELMQIDGSPQDWFEGWADPCVLLVFIDDATGEPVQICFVESESFFGYCQAAKGYFRCCGKPVAFYNDKNSIFGVNVPSTGAGEALIQLGRAMQELEHWDHLRQQPAVERVIQTLQERLPTPPGPEGTAPWGLMLLQRSDGTAL